MSNKILLVDDEPLLLTGLRRNLMDEFEISCANSGMEALHNLQTEEDFSVIISDYKMVGMNGVEFLQEAKIIRPDAVRMLLTGFADVGVLTNAINEGSIFRFLSKPCNVQHMRLAIRGGIKQFRLVRSEKELLDKTLMGCVQVFGELISNFDPVLYTQVKTIRDILHILPRYKITEGLWEAEIAVLLSHLGWLTVPPTIIDKLHASQPLEPSEQQVIAGVPKSTCRLLAHIPRLEAVTETILHEREPCATEAAYSEPSSWMILRACKDLVILRARSKSYSDTLEGMEKTASVYHPACLLALRAAMEEITKLDTSETTGSFQTTIKELLPGMIILDSITTNNGLVIVPANHQLHAADIERVRNFEQTFSLKDSVRARF